MKLLKLYIISTILIFLSSCGAQNNSKEKQVENMLLEFYSMHFYIWENTPISAESPLTVLQGKLDSLMLKHCTSKLINEQKVAFENVGADLLTNDLIGSFNENLKIEKDSKIENNYIVSFKATYKEPSGGQLSKQVVLHVSVIEIGGVYKIDSIK